MCGAGDLVVARAYCEAFVAGDVFDPGLWLGDPLKFLSAGLADFIKRSGGDAIDEEFDLTAAINCGFPMGYGLEAPESKGEVYLYCELNSVSVVYFKRLYRLLERQRKGAGAVFVQRFELAVGRWWPVFGTIEIEINIEARNEQLAEEWAYESTEAKREDREPNFDGFEVVTPEFPDLAKWKPRRRLGLPQSVVLSSLCGLERLARSAAPPKSYGDDCFGFVDADSPVPLLSIQMYDGDQLNGWLDEHLDYASQIDHWPTYFERIPGPAVACAALRRFGVALRVLAAAAELIAKIEGRPLGKRRGSA